MADLPWADNQVTLKLSVRHLFCYNPDCGRKIFSEHLHPTIAAYSRRTARLEEYLQTLGLLVGGELIALLAELLNICSLCADTILNLILKSPDVVTTTPTILGIDECAIHNGRTYATILQDPQTGSPIDLLEDDKVESIEAWINAHPGVEIISRDRVAVFADAA